MKKRWYIVFLFMLALVVGQAQPYDGNTKIFRYEPDSIKVFDIDYNTQELYLAALQAHWYNEFGLLIGTERIYRYDPNDDFENDSRQIFTYNSEYLLESQRLILWDYDLNAWLNFQRVGFTYLNGKIESAIWSYWDDEENSFIYNTKQATTYDDHGKFLALTFFQWDGTDWIENGGNDYVNRYDANNNLISQTIIERPDSTFIYYYSYTYDERGNMITDTFDREISGVREKIECNAYNYDGNNNLLQRTTMEWDNESNSYLYASWNGRITYTYDGNNNRTSHLRETYDYDLGAWRIDGWNPRLLWTYENDNAVLIRSFAYNSETGEWVNNTSGHVDLLYNNMRSQYELMLGGHQFEISYHKFGFPTKIKNEVVTSIHCFPNPTTENIYFSGISEPNYVTIYDFSGKIVDRQIITTNGQSISMKHLKSGIYFVDIKNETEHFTRKIVKQ